MRAQTRRRGCDPGDAARADTEGCTARATTEQAKAGKEKAPGRTKPRRARRAKDRRDAESPSQRARGMKPLKRGRAGPAVRNAAAIANGPSMIRNVGNSFAEYRRQPNQCAEAERSRRQARAGETETAGR